MTELVTMTITVTHNPSSPRLPNHWVYGRRRIGDRPNLWQCMHKVAAQCSHNTTDSKININKFGKEKRLAIREG